MKSSMKATIVLGFNPGYYNNAITSPSEDMYKDLQKHLEDYANEHNDAYVSFVISESTCIYRPAWGCPEGGEPVFVLNATMNPKFDKDPNEWIMKVTGIARHLKETYEQRTVTLTITDAECIYLN